MYQLKITKNTERLALQHFNDVKERLLADIHHFLSGKHRIMRKVKIAIHGDKPCEDLLRHLSNEENLKELIVSHPDKLRDIISQLHPDAFNPEKKLNRILYHIFIILDMKMIYLIRMVFIDKAKWEPVLIAIWQISIILLQQRCLRQKKEYWIIFTPKKFTQCWDYLFII